MKKLLSIAVAGCLALSLVLCGCGSSSSSSTTSTQEQKTAQLNEAVPITTKYGDVEVTVLGFVNSASMRTNFAKSENLTDDKGVGLLLITLSNISYVNKNVSSGGNTDYVVAKDVFSVVAPDGTTMSPMNEYSSYQDYESAGNYITCTPGQKKKIAVFYVIANNIDQVTVKIGNTSVTVPVTKA